MLEDCLYYFYIMSTYSYHNVTQNIHMNIVVLFKICAIQNFSSVGWVRVLHIGFPLVFCLGMPLCYCLIEFG